MEDNPVIPILIGCTASGKTGILMKLSERRRIEIISADSRQVYRGMDIGTAKPSLEEQSLLPHHLLDRIDPDEVYSAGMFANDARKLIIDIRKRGSIPVISGGTAFYLLALTGGLDPLPSRCDGIREGLKAIEEEIPGKLYEILRCVDQERADTIGRNDVRRLVRALEIFILTGKPPSTLRIGGDSTERKKFRIAGISVSRDELRRRIRTRAVKMIESGLIQEVEGLKNAGWGRESALGCTIGYSEILDYLDGSITSLEGIVEAISINTWHLVRRQKNMFRRIDGVRWMEGNPVLIEKYLFTEG